MNTSPLAYVYHTSNDPSARRYRIKGLQKATAYNIVIKAYNGVGPGPESQPVEVKTRESGKRLLKYLPTFNKACCRFFFMCLRAEHMKSHLRR